MLSLSYISPHIIFFPHQQLPQPFTLEKCKRLSLSQKIRNFGNSLRFTSFTKSLVSSTECRALSSSDENVNDGYSMLSCDTGLIFQPEDSAAIGKWIQSCCNIEEIRKVHAIVVKSVKDPLMFVNNNLISVYVKYGDLVAARRVFDKMPETNVVSWTALLNGYQKYGTVNEGLRFLSEFINSGCDRNAQTYVCMLNSCIKTFDYELGKQLHACVIKTQSSNLILDCALLQFYSRCSDLDGAFLVFDRMEKQDVVSWTTMITACSQHKLGQEAFVMLRRMLSYEVEPNEFTICSLITACGEESNLTLGRQLHCMVVKKAYDLDIYIGTSLVDMYAKCDQIDDSKSMFDGMKKKNAVTWTSIVSGYARNGRGDEAIKLFRTMKRLKLHTSNLTMVCILRACGLLKSLSTAKEIHAQILKNYAQGNIFIGSALVWLYCKCGQYSSANKVLQYLPDKDVVSWTAMISGCARLGHENEALEHLKEMLGEGVEPNPFTFSSALKACAKLENIEQGRLIHSSINKTPSLSNVFVGSALVHMYSKCGNLSEAVQVFDSMPEKNLVSWKAMIVAYAKNGLCGEALKLVYRMQAEGIDLDDYIISTVLTACGDFKWDPDSSPQAFANCK